MKYSKTVTDYFSTKTFLLFTLLTISTGNLQAQNETILLWNNEIPESKSAINYNEIHNTTTDQVSKVTTPTLSLFIPEKPNGTAIIVNPGGGYAFLAINKEGYKVAKWLNTLGITAFVLKYRLPSDQIMIDKTIGPLQDAQEAMRYVRRNAKKWNLNPKKVGVIGFSAGGHLAATLSTHYNDTVYKVSDTISARPDFSILIYPVLSMKEDLTHKGSRNNLLGTTATASLIEKYSTEKHIDSLTPPTILIHAIDDKTVAVENSINYFLGLRKNNVSSEIHLYQNGKHGFGLGKEGTTSQNWTKQCEDWLRLNNFMTTITSPKK